MKMIFCGDPHGRFEQVLMAAQREPNAPVILLGDLQPDQPLEQEMAAVWDRLWWIHGNHDTDDELWAARLWSEATLHKSLHARVVELDCGVKVAGLGGVFRSRVWSPSEEPRYASRARHVADTPRHLRWRGGPSLKHWSTIFPDEYDMLSRQKCDVLVLHEAPGYHRFGVPLLDELARRMSARVVVHGHHHDRLDSSQLWEEQGFASFGVELRGVLTVDLDEF